MLPVWVYNNNLEATLTWFFPPPFLFKHTKTKKPRDGNRPLSGKDQSQSQKPAVFLTFRPLKVPTPAALSSTGIWRQDAECTLSSPADSEKRQVKAQKVQFKCATPAIHAAPVCFPTGSTGVQLSIHSIFYVALSKGHPLYLRCDVLPSV